MHIDFTVTLGNIIVFFTMMGGIWRFETVVGRFLVEHEILIREYCDRNNIKLDNLPTRLRVGMFTFFKR